MDFVFTSVVPKCENLFITDSNHIVRRFIDLGRIHSVSPYPIYNGTCSVYLSIMKLLIVTRADDNIKSITDLTHPLMRDYAERCGADFKVIDTESPCKVGDGRWHYRILQIFNYYNSGYDRIIHLDSDVVINKDCPNLFKVVPPECIGTVFEDVGSRQSQRRGMIAKIQKQWGDVGWRARYINTGVFVTSAIHRDIFLYHDNGLWEDWGGDDMHLGYRIHSLGFDTCLSELPFQFNHMSMFSEEWNGSRDRFDSHIIHYAGHGNFPGKGTMSREALMQHDIDRIYG